MPVIDSTPTAPHEAFRHTLTELIARLKDAAPIDFGGIARRPSAQGDRLVESLWHERATLLSAPSTRDYIEAEVAYLVRGWAEWSYDRNQFFDIDPCAAAGLRRIHRALFAGVFARLQDAGCFEEFARACYLSYVLYVERLARIFRPLVTTEALRGRAAEYSPEMQLRLLGLGEREWREPIVDLGCGVDAHLVHYLRARGLSATGIERRGGGQFILERDWFNVRFEPSTLGTIISHLAFSLHFLHHHWQSADRAYDYARKYMELLRSLMPGGTFCYAPGLPFIEAMLDASYFDVTTLALPEPLATTIGSLRDLGTGQSVAYSCQVRRR